MLKPDPRSESSTNSARFHGSDHQPGRAELVGLAGVPGICGGYLETGRLKHPADLASREHITAGWPCFELCRAGAAADEGVVDIQPSRQCIVTRVAQDKEVAQVMPAPLHVRERFGCNPCIDDQPGARLE